MRNKGSERSEAAAFSELITELATKAGYDLRDKANGKLRLAADTGMSVSAVRRMLRGETLPRVEAVYSLAAALRADEERLLDTAGYRTSRPHEKRSAEPVLSDAPPLTPDGVADALGITNPFLRKVLITNAAEVMRLQREADQTDGDDGTGGQVVAR
ncbi:helix-turn-helix domain-containing protein [Streptomyces sp. AMCC400023]|uniref:helix-turn-helix domain-containing protein n=1 Tax=Streptomyces sp. AMCC400023 TaxID=2056258 RepID=UPI001F21BF42|nr:helix-turn-helix transcriptional regulator [Streptomyces sp. AMCC400023]UJV42905.1 XRE family transcriptional regulator [Streptomyces sp. AMCC400023]